MADYKSERIQLNILEKFLKEKNFSEALILGDKLIADFPASFPVRLYYTRILKGLNRLTEAESSLGELNRSFPDNLTILLEMGDLLFRQKRYEESLAYFKKVLFLDSFNTEARANVTELQRRLETKTLEKLEDTLVEMRMAEPETAPPVMHAADDEKPDEEPEIDIEVDRDSEVQVPLEDEPLPPRIPPPVVEPPPERSRADTSFSTESAAELYLKQGLYDEARGIYQQLYDKTGKPELLMKRQQISALLKRERERRTMARLIRVLEVIQERRRDLV